MTGVFVLSWIMDKLATSFLFLLFATCSFAQVTPGPTPQPADETNVVKITTTHIQLDVTITDSKGRVLTDIRPDEVELFENGEKQTITNFSFISNLGLANKKAAKADSGAVALPPNAIKAEQVRRSIALIVDDLTLSFESTYQVRRALRKFVDEQMQDGDLVAIIRTGASIGALQQFTTDKRLLRAAIERVRWNPSGIGDVGAFARVPGIFPPRNSEPVPGERTEEGIETEYEDFRESIFAAGTLGAVRYVVGGMQDLPGRKSILLLSDGFKLLSPDPSGWMRAGRVYEGLLRLVDFANRASVVIYTMDARGMQSTALMAADDPSVEDGDVARLVPQIEATDSTRRKDLIETQASLQFLAKETGGISIRNTNDLSGGIRKILDDQSYYLVGYEPQGETFDPTRRRFNNLEIKVTRPGTRVRYRSGFFGFSDDKLLLLRQTGIERLETAIISPFATNEIALRLNTIFSRTAAGDPVIRSLVHVSGQDLKLTDEPDGRKKAVFDVLAAGFGDNGRVFDQTSKTYTIIVTRQVYERILRQGFVYDLSFVPRLPGAYQMRVALRDHRSDKVGSASQFFEFPNLKKKHLLLSGVVLENFEYKEWVRRNGGGPADPDSSDPLISTSLRQFRPGTVLNYAFSIYNAKQNPAPNLSYQTRMFRDGKLISEGPIQRMDPAGSTAAGSVNFIASLGLGSGMLPGDYVLQVVITDNLARAKRNTASQFIQFEIVD